MDFYRNCTNYLKLFLEGEGKYRLEKIIQNILLCRFCVKFTKMLDILIFNNHI